jgi:O-antigen ligase
MNTRLKATQIHYYLLLALGFLIPSGFYRLEGIVIGLLLGSWLFSVKGFGALKSPGFSTLAIWSFFGVMAAGLFYTAHPEAQWAYLGRRLAFLFVPLVFVGVRLTPRQYEGILAVFTFSALFFILIANGYALFDILYSGESEILIRRSIYRKFSYYGLTRIFEDWHPTYVSLFLNLALVFSYRLLYQKSRFALWIFCSLIAIVNIFLLNSFIGILAFIILLTIFLYLRLQHRRIVFLASILLLSLLIGVNIFYNPLGFEKIEKFKNTELRVTDKKQERNVLTLRLAKWKTSFQVFATSPLFGVSNGDYIDRLVDQYKVNGFSYSAEERYASHNQYLYTLVSNGLVGLLLLLALLTGPLILDSASREYVPFLMLISVFFLTEDLLARQQGIVFFVFFYILMTRKTPPETHNENDGGRDH